MTGHAAISRTLQTIAASERKRQLVLGLARGLTLGELAEQEGISERTVKSHITQMRLSFGGIPRRELPRAWFLLTGENPYPDDAELEMER